MKRYVRADGDSGTSQFHAGSEYKLIRKNGELAARTFFVEKVSHKNLAIKVKGGINGIFNLKIANDGNEMIMLGMNDRNYLNPSSADIV